MKNLNSSYILVLFFGIFLLASCNKDEPIIEDPEELITTVELTLTEINTSETVVLRFRDIDGDGGNEPEITGGTLKTASTYAGSVVFLNESVSPVENVTDEILEEDEEHQVFYQSSDLLSIDYDDMDSNNAPIGIRTFVRTTDTTGPANLTVILRHEPAKDGAGVADGDITNAGGETDIEVVLPITIE